MKVFNFTEVDQSSIYFEAISDKMKKLKSLCSKAVEQFTLRKNQHFSRYLQRLSQLMISGKYHPTNQKPISLKRTKSKHKKKAIDQLKLPFEVYIYSSQDSQSQPFDQVPFYISDSSISGLSEEDQENQRIQSKMEQIEKKIFSFAKQKKMFQSPNHMQNKVLEGLDDEGQKNSNDCELLEQFISVQVLEEIVQKNLERYFTKFDSSSEQTFSDCPQQEVRYQNELQKEIKKSLEESLNPYFESSFNELIQQIKQHYFTSIYLPSEVQSLEQKIYLKQQQHQIKKNQLETLDSLLKQVRNNKKIHSTLNHVKTTKSFQNSKNTPRINPKKNLVVPLLDLESLPRENARHSKESKALTSKRKQNQQTDRSHKLDKVSSKAGRRYYYDKDNQSLSKKNSTQKRSAKLISNENPLSQPQQQKIQKLSHENLAKLDDKDSMTKKFNFHQIMNENLSPNHMFSKDKVSHNQQLLLQDNNLPVYMREHQSKLHLKQIQLEQEYKANLREVITFEIDHLKTQLDLITSSLQALIAQNQNKYMRVDVMDRINSLKTKRDSIKKKLKAKIKEFWKIASTPNVIHNS